MHILKGSVENNVPSYISAEKKSLQKLFVLLKIDTFRKMDTFTKNILKREAVVSDTGERGGDDTRETSKAYKRIFSNRLLSNLQK